jgi:hypothetical protein
MCEKPYATTRLDRTAPMTENAEITTVFTK